MGYKKTLVICLVVILSMFGLMLTTSYAWYSFEKGSTTFDVVTNNDDIEVSFLKGEYINNVVGVPIKAEDVDRFSDKHQFVVKTKNNREDNEIMVSISLVDIVMDNDLLVDAFKIELYHQGTRVKTFSGDSELDGKFLVGDEVSKKLVDIVLDDDIDNQFELRVYLLDDGSDQSALMSKSFQAKMQVEVVSRLKTTVNNWDSPDISITSIMVDGSASKSLPTDGLYDMNYTCDKGSKLSWSSYDKTITYESGSKINDSCRLEFVKSSDYIYLNEVEPGSYVKYVGTNGCVGDSCKGNNFNYQSDMKMGQCFNGSYQFFVNGWRVGYIKDNTAYLISAGATNCVNLFNQYKSDKEEVIEVLTDYYYGSGYVFDDKTGMYQLTGVTKKVLSWNKQSVDIIANSPYTCKSTSSNGSCSTMYQVVDYISTNEASVLPYYNYDGIGTPNLIDNLNKVARSYCNSDYAYGGVCDDSTSWAMGSLDFKNIMGNDLSFNSCYNQYGSSSCGYRNDLINNGSYYWITGDNSSVLGFYWNAAYLDIEGDNSSSLYGVRPVLRMDSKVRVVGGSGTYEDPYQIKK